MKIVYLHTAEIELFDGMSESWTIRLSLKILEQGYVKSLT